MSYLILEQFDSSRLRKTDYAHVSYHRNHDLTLLDWLRETDYADVNYHRNHDLTLLDRIREIDYAYVNYHRSHDLISSPHYHRNHDLISRHPTPPSPSAKRKYYI